MKYLIMTEGSCEKALIDVLINKNIFKYEKNELLYEDIYQARQIKNNLIEKINQLHTNEKVTIIRIGDKLNDNLEIIEDITSKINEIIKICIKPEFEILHLIHQNLFDEYNKVKSDFSPSAYLYSKDKKYYKSYDYNYKYFNLMSIKEIYLLFNCYNKKRKGTHNKDEQSILDLIKKEKY